MKKLLLLLIIPLLSFGQSKKELLQILEQRDATIESLNKIIEERDATIESLNKIIEERDEELGSLIKELVAPAAILKFKELDNNFRPDSSFTGIGYSFYENGQIEFMAKFTNGDNKIGNSFYLEFSETGKIEFESYYQDGKLYLERGVVRNGPGKGGRWERQYKNGKLHKRLSWNQDGIRDSYHLE